MRKLITYLYQLIIRVEILMIGRLFGILLAPYRAWRKALDETMSGIMEMKEPNRSRLLSYLAQDLIFPTRGEQ